jgi:repressor LexA
MAAMKYKSPHSAMLIMQELCGAGFLEKKPGGGLRLAKDLPSNEVARTVSVPLVGTVAAGTPILAEENIEGFIPISLSLAKPGSKYFLLRVRGDSMNEVGINDGDFVLVKQQPLANTGDRVVALIDDDTTVKEFHPRCDVVVLKPRSTNPANTPIIVDHDFQIQGVVVATVPKFK